MPKRRLRTVYSLDSVHKPPKLALSCITQSRGRDVMVKSLKICTMGAMVDGFPLEKLLRTFSDPLHFRTHYVQDIGKWH